MSQDQNQDSKLFIGNVAYATNIQTLVDLFSEFGKVVDSYKPLEKGYAFITMETKEQAQAAQEALNDREVDGRQIKIDFAKPREERPRRDFGGQSRGGFGGGQNRGGGRDRGFSRDRY